MTLISNSSMITSLKKIAYITSLSWINILFLALGFIIASFLEAFGIGLIGPFVFFATKPEGIHKNSLTNFFYVKFGINDPKVFVAMIGVFIVVFMIIKSLTTYKIQTVIREFSNNREAMLMDKLFHSYLSAPYNFHLHKDSSYIIHTVCSNVRHISQGVLLPLLTIVANVVTIFFISIILCIASPLITLSVLITAIPLFLLLNVFNERVKLWGKQVTEANEKSSRFAYQALGGIKEVQLIGCNSYFEDLFSAENQKYISASSSFFAFQIAPRIVLELVFVSLIISTTIVSLLSVGDISDTTATLGVFALAALRLIPASSNLASSLTSFRKSNYIIEKLYHDILEIQENQSINWDKISTRFASNISDTRLQKELTSNITVNTNIASFKNSIKIDNISFRYDGSNGYALKNFNLNIRKGECIGIIGKSGSGKSTFVDILLGLLKPNSGDIIFDNKNIYDDIIAWRKLIGYVPQSIYLIDDTIAKNIAFGIHSNQVDHKRLIRVIEAAQLSDVVDKLPDGLETRVGERGIRLSGGQRQRIGIARALYHGQEILVMDEATSALDNETEKLVTRAIESIAQDRTMIIIAHRLSTIKHCNRVLQMDNGEIINQGSYEDVVSR